MPRAMVEQADDDVVPTAPPQRVNTSPMRMFSGAFTKPRLGWTALSPGGRRTASHLGGSLHDGTYDYSSHQEDYSASGHSCYYDDDADADLERFGDLEDESLSPSETEEEKPSSTRQPTLPTRRMSSHFFKKARSNKSLSSHNSISSTSNLSHSSNEDDEEFCYSPAGRNVYNAPKSHFLSPGAGSTSSRSLQSLPEHCAFSDDDDLDDASSNLSAPHTPTPPSPKLKPKLSLTRKFGFRKKPRPQSTLMKQLLSYHESKRGLLDDDDDESEDDDDDDDDDATNDTAKVNNTTAVKHMERIDRLLKAREAKVEELELLGTPVSPAKRSPRRPKKPGNNKRRVNQHVRDPNNKEDYYTSTSFSSKKYRNYDEESPRPTRSSRSSSSRGSRSSRRRQDARKEAETLQISLQRRFWTIVVCLVVFIIAIGAAIGSFMSHRNGKSAPETGLIVEEPYPTSAPVTEAAPVAKSASTPIAEPVTSAPATSAPTSVPVSAPVSVPTEVPVSATASASAHISAPIPISASIPISAPVAPVSLPMSDKTSSLVDSAMFRQLRPSLYSSTIQAIEKDPSSPQAKAMRWLIDNHGANAVASTASLVQSFAVATIYHSWSVMGYEAPSDVCEWRDSMSGVTCEDSVVTKLVFAYSAPDHVPIKGTVPPELGLLSNLTVLVLSGHGHLGGSLPTELENLGQLTKLDLSSNILHGRLPTKINDKLQTLNLSNNRFVGHVRESMVTEKADLTMLNLSRNKLSGPLPIEALSKLPHLKELFLDGNEFYGDLDPVACHDNQSLDHLTVKADCGGHADLVCACCQTCCNSEGQCTDQFQP